MKKGFFASETALAAPGSPREEPAQLAAQAGPSPAELASMNAHDRLAALTQHGHDGDHEAITRQPPVSQPPAAV